MENCVDHPWQPTRECARCGHVLCVLCTRACACAVCVQPSQVVEEVPAWEEHGAFLPTLRAVMMRPRRTFSRMSEGEVGTAWTFAALCCLVPRLLYGVLDGRGGPGLMLMRALVSAAVQAASATFFLGSLHFLVVLCLARSHARWSLSARAAGYAQPITMVLGTLVASLMVWSPPLRESTLLRDVALFASATWYTLPLTFVGERLGLDRARSLLAALVTSFGIVLAMRALS